MKLTKDQETKLTEMAFAEKSNKEIAAELGIELTDVHAARSRLGITIPKIKELKTKGVQPVLRTEEEIIEEIKKVRKAWKEALRKGNRCEERLDQLIEELEAAK
jgi:hypothetical protein